MSRIFAYAGTWTVQSKESGGGIGIYEYDPAAGGLKWIDTVKKDIVAGKMSIDRRRGVLYSTDESSDNPMFHGNGGGGRILAFRIDPGTGMLTEINEQPSFGTLPVYLQQDGTGKWLVATNHSDKRIITKYIKGEDGKFHVVTDYSTVTAVVYPVLEDGALGDATDVVPFREDRRVMPPQLSCLHYVGFAQDGKHLVITNMKQDFILMYELDTVKGQLIECDRIRCPHGSFPHYGAFHPEKRIIYINNEHAHILEVLAFDDDWQLKIIQTLDVTPQLTPGVKGKIMQTDIGVSPDGRFVYDLFRGPNSVWVFDVDPMSGKLAKKQEFFLGGEGNPRGFAFSPDGKFMLIADNYAHEIRTLKVEEDGTLSDTGRKDGNLRYPGNLAFYTAE